MRAWWKRFKLRWYSKRHNYCFIHCEPYWSGWSSSFCEKCDTEASITERNKKAAAIDAAKKKLGVCYK